MELHVKKANKLEGAVQIPASKSHSIRALFLATLANGTSSIKNFLDSEDTKAAIKVCKALGARITKHGSDLEVISSGIQNSGLIYSGNSGLTTRFVLPLLGLLQAPILLNVGEQMAQRPIRPLIDALNSLGMEISNNYPLKVSGQLIGGKVEIDGSSSQYISALLMALPLAEGDSEITVNNLKERPYLDITLEWLRDLGVKVEERENTFFIPGGQSYKAFTKTIPGDFSSASYLMAANHLIPGKLDIKGLDMQDLQGDKVLLSLLEEMDPIIDCTDIPDLVPTLAVLATQQKRTIHLKNAGHTRTKETDRIHSMAQGLRAMGANIEEKEDGLIIQPSQLKGASVSGYGDHRSIMALAIAGLIAEGETVIQDADGIAKTYPGFIETMQNLGAEITQES